MWPDLELIGVYPSRFSGVYFTGKGVFPFSIRKISIILASIINGGLRWTVAYQESSFMLSIAKATNFLPDRHDLPLRLGDRGRRGLRLRREVASQHMPTVAVEPELPATTR